MKKVFAVTATLALLCLGSLAQAITIDTVAIGNKGNAADTTGYGSVAYNYNIGKYEVTAGQYTAFLNAKASVSDPYGLYNDGMWINHSTGCGIERTSISGGYSYSVDPFRANAPVNYVSFWDACRFANWLCNGQGTGDTENGAYTLRDYMGTDGRAIQRKVGWTWAVASEDEWYKAAYYTGSGYSLYANGTGTAPVAGTDSNYGDAIDDIWDGTTHGALEQNGTKDMMGNVYEWNEAIPYISGADAYRGLRGGSFLYDIELQSSGRGSTNPDNEYYLFGFRVTQAVPEPSSIMALAGGLIGLIGLRRRRG